jgi:hypothetical protein
MNNDNNSLELTKHERRMLRKRHHDDERQRTVRRQAARTWLIIAGLIVITSAVSGAVFLYNRTRPRAPAADVVARAGLHWHPEISIVLKGQRQEIPANVGIGAVHNPLHTHDSSGVIHLEFEGLVTIDDLRLGQFFQVWNKPFSSTCILDKCNDSTGQVTMMVNGQQNTEFERYIMRDKDTIEIRYE